VIVTGASMASDLHAALVARDGARHGIANGAIPVCSGNGEIVGAMLVFRAQADGRGRDTTATSLPTVDLSILRGQVGDDPDVVDEFLRRFTANLHELMDELRGVCWRGQPARAAVARATSRRRRRPSVRCGWPPSAIARCRSSARWA
jgi:hypothetical protein